MLWFCRRLLRYTLPPSDPVSQRLLLVIHYVYTKEIKPKNRVYQDDGNNSVQWELIKITWKDFTEGVIVLHRLVSPIRSEDNNSFDDRLLSTAIAKYKQEVLKKICDKLRPAKDVSDANGFAREKIKSNISVFWKSLFDDEVTPEVIRNEIVSELFPPFLGKSSYNDIQSLPVYSPYILGTDFAKDELKEEAVKLGAELSLYMAESMFLLCDDIRRMLRFCLKLLRDSMMELKPASPVGDTLLRVIHYVNSRHIKPKNGVYQLGGKSVQLALVVSTFKDFDAAIRELNTLVLSFTVLGDWSDCREVMTRVEEALKKVEEKLRRAKDVSEARDDDAMKSNILELWRSLFDKETEEAWAQKLVMNDMVSDVFHHLIKGAAA